MTDAGDSGPIGLRGRRALVVALAGGACMAAAGPAAAFPGAAALVVPGLAALWLTCTRATRPLRWVYLQQLLHFLWFSGSLGLVMWPGYLGVALVGPLYLVVVVALLGAWMRSDAPLVWRAIAFGAGVAGAEYARAFIGEIPYPHCQPIHAFAFWPPEIALAPVRLGGQPFGNFLIALLGVGLAERLGGRRARAGLVLFCSTAAAWLVCAGVVAIVDGSGRPVEQGPRVLLVQTGLDPILWLEDGQDVEELRERRTDETIRTLIEPTRQRAGVGASDPPDLVVWPEGSWPFHYRGAERPTALRAAPVALAPESRLLAQGYWVPDPDGDDYLGVVALLDRRGRVESWQEKRRPVPIGERPPLADYMPQGLRAAIIEYADKLLGRPGFRFLRTGSLRSPIELPDGTLLGAMVCYDNAFADHQRRLVAAGARFTCVLSDESWYRGGHELDQLLALTICHAVETRTPVVRASVDGVTGMVDASGRLVASLPRGEAGVLEVRVPLGPGHLPPLAWLPPLIRWALMAAFALAAAAAARKRGILAGNGLSPFHQAHRPGGLDEP